MLVSENDAGKTALSSAYPSFEWVTGALLKHKLLVVFCTIAGVALFVGAELAITPVYKASTTLLVVQGEGSTDLELTKLVAAHAGIAESPQVIQSAIEQVGLENFP